VTYTNRLKQQQLAHAREAQWIIATDWFKYYRDKVLK
jgi:hypothetical protein